MSSSNPSSLSSTSNADAYTYGKQYADELCMTFHNYSLYECALIILNEPDPQIKAQKTFAIYKAYQENLLTFEKFISPSSSSSVPLSLPSKPARPDYVTEVDARKVKSNSKKSMIHALIHAESYAIDLAWDVIARFGYNPETWIIPHDMEGTMSTYQSTSADATSTTVPLTQAPKEFFDDWIKVASEEALHFTKWRLRLLEFGGHYGEFPGHQGLWESAEETSLSSIARMSIVHCVLEARGLDVAPIMRTKFEKSQDYASIEILDQNHKEEIGHVHYGKKWFEWFLQYNHYNSTDTIDIFHKFVKTYFRGILRPPFNDTSRQLAGFTSEWYVPLSKADFNPNINNNTNTNNEETNDEETE